MGYSISSTPNFDREFKRLFKKFPSLKSDILKLTLQLESNALIGKLVFGNVYKIRMVISSKGKGKSGGARVITCVKIIDEVVYLLAIYDKSELSTLKDKEIAKRVKGLE